jgi:hypothetical protein
MSLSSLNTWYKKLTQFNAAFIEIGEQLVHGQHGVNFFRSKP